MSVDEKVKILRKAIRANNYTAEELHSIIDAFYHHESTCYPLENVRISQLLEHLCENLTEFALLPICVHIPGKKEFMPDCLLVVNTGDQADFRRVVGHGAKGCQIPRFFQMVPHENGKMFCAVLLSTQEGVDFGPPKAAKLLQDGKDRYLVLRTWRKEE